MTDREGSVRAAEKLLTSGAVDEAVAEFTRIADRLDTDGFSQRAAALYKKILKIRPEDENALWRLGNISASLGLMLDARSQLSAVADLRLERGDLSGAEAAQVRLKELDEAEVQVRLAGAQTQAEFGESSTAVQRLKTAALDLQQKGKISEALALLAEAAMFDPADATLRQSLVDAYIAQGDFDTACQFATSAAELRRVADELFRMGREDEGLNVLATAVEVDPQDAAVRADLAKRLAARGDFDGARDLAAANAGARDVEMQWALAEVALREGRRLEGIALFEEILADEPWRRDALVDFGCAIADRQTDDALACIEVAVQSAIEADDWQAAADAMDRCVARMPGHVPALMRLVEICVDGGLDERMRDAQERVVDAYLADGAGREAKVIAEDLVSRDPADVANVERLRRAQVLLGETVAAPAPIDDGRSTMADRRSVPLEDVLQTLRDDTLRDPSPEAAEQHFKLAATYMEIGMREEALAALQAASRSPKHRCRAAAMLGKAYIDAGDRVAALEWYERAVEAQSPSDDARRALLYDVALLLEAQNEHERALAVLLELQSDAGDYRDVAAKLEQLKVQIGR